MEIAFLALLCGMFAGYVSFRALGWLCVLGLLSLSVQADESIRFHTQSSVMVSYVNVNRQGDIQPDWAVYASYDGYTLGTMPVLGGNNYQGDTIKVYGARNSVWVLLGSFVIDSTYGAPTDEHWYTWNGSDWSTPVDWTNYVACITVTNRDYITGQRWTPVVIPQNTNNSAITLPYQVVPYKATYTQCVTNSEDFTLVMTGERPDMDTSEQYSARANPQTGNNPKPGDGSGGLGNNPPNNNPTSPSQIDTNASAIVKAIGELKDVVAKEAKQNEQIVIAGGSGGGSGSAVGTNADYSGLLREIKTNTAGILSQSGTNLLGTNFWLNANADSNQLAQSMGATSNAWMGAYMSNAAVVFTGTNKASGSGMRSVWTVGLRTNVFGEVKQVSFSPGDIPMSRDLAPWIKLTCYFFLVLYGIYFVFEEVQDDAKVLGMTPGGNIGKGTWTWASWSSGVVAVGIAFGALPVILGVGISAVLDRAGVSILSPLSAAGIASAGSWSVYIYAGIETLEYFFPLAFALALGLYLFIFTCISSATLVAAQRVVRHFGN